MKKIPLIKKILSFQLYLLAFLLLNICCVGYASQEQLTQKFQNILDTAVADSSLTPGAVLLVSSPKIGTITVASGYADKITQTPMKVDNNFRIASISKTFVAVVVLKLSEEGILNLDDKISALLPDTIDIDRLPNGKKVTVKQLLQMRSGIPNYTDYDGYSDKVFANPNLHWTPETGVEIIYDEKPNFAPGSSYEYANTNFLLLQSIVETVTDSTLAQQLRKYIFDPLKLKHTYLEIQEEQEGGFYGLKTHGYEKEDKKLKDVTELNDGLGLGDGGIISTAQDLATFVQALLQTKTLLPENLLHEMLTVKGPDKYGLGIYREQVGDEWPWTHNGTSSGFVTQFYYFPDKKLTIIVLTNSTDADIIDDVADKVLKIINKN